MSYDFDTTRIIERNRREFCTPKPGGGWLCKCGNELPDERALSCRECSAKAEQVEAQRALERWKRGVQIRCSFAFSGMPQWSHVTTREAFAATIENKSLQTFSERWNPQSGSALFLGPSGCGKTSTAARTLRRLESERIQALLDDPESRAAAQTLDELARSHWTTATKLVEALGIYGNELGAEPIRRAREASILVIDELGPEPAKHIGVLFDVIDRRYAEQRPTIATSGLTLAAFSNRYGDAFTRRICDSAVGRLVDLHPKGATNG